MLVRALLEQGWQVRVLVQGANAPPALAGLKLDLVRGSVTDPGAVARLVADVDVVFHLAARIELDRDPGGQIYRVNVEGTRLVAQNCLKRQLLLVHCSSHHALQIRPLDQPFDESRPLALEDSCVYHRSKAQGEQLVHDLVRERGLQAVVVNPGTLVGPADYAPSLLGRGLLDLYHGRLPALLNIESDCADSRDVASGIIAAARSGRIGERYLLSGEVATMRDIAAIWGRLTKARLPRLMLPLWVGWLALPVTLGSARLLRRKPLFTPNMLRHSMTNRHVSCAKARDELGYASRALEDSLRDQLEFYRSQGWTESAAAY